MNLADLLSDTPFANPYDFANPIKQLSELVGRDSQKRDIQYYIDLAKRGTNINLALIGPRAAGKTSLLNYTEAIAHKSGFTPVRINLNTSDASPLDLFSKIFDNLFTAACMDDYLGGLDAAFYKNFRRLRDTRRDMDLDLHGHQVPRHLSELPEGGRLSESLIDRELRLIGENHVKPFALLIDEADVLSETRTGLEMLRNVFMNQGDYLIVLAGTPRLLPELTEVFSPIIRQFKKVNVDRFEHLEETRKCMCGPLEAIGINPGYGADEIPIPNPALVHRLTGGRPYEIRLLCHFMFRRVEAGYQTNLEVTTRTIELVQQELTIREDWRTPFIAALHELSEREMQHLRLVSRAQGASITELWALARTLNDFAGTLPELEDAARALESKGIITIDDAAPVLMLDDLEDVYLRYYSQNLGIPMDLTRTTLEDHFTEVLSNSSGPQTQPEDPDVGYWGESKDMRFTESVCCRQQGDTDGDWDDWLYWWFVENPEKEFDITECDLIIVDPNGQRPIGKTTSLSGIVGPSRSQALVDMKQDIEARTAGYVRIDLRSRKIFTPSRDQIIEAVRFGAPTHVKHNCCRYHLNEFYALWEPATRNEAINELKTSLAFAEINENCTAMAHVCLINEDWVGAATWARKGSELPARGDRFYASGQHFSYVRDSVVFTLYDLAVAQIALGELAEARRVVSRLTRLVESLTTSATSSGEIARIDRVDGAFRCRGVIRVTNRDVVNEILALLASV
ncbi:ATP-binding protein [Nostocoides veronense]|uniref:AAA+ ATPase domain-containing protein n=1 Tax=Nostocoides veronense TaxID=330836 RepID=A0ABP4Y0E7_9MICO